MANILYLENHAVFAEQVTQRFLADHRIVVVPSISEAREALQRATFDLIFSDYDLDDGKGDEFVRGAKISHPDTPIVAVSSHEAGNTALLQAGAAAVCSKMEFNRIGQVIEVLLNEKRTM